MKYFLFIFIFLSIFVARNNSYYEFTQKINEPDRQVSESGTTSHTHCGLFRSDLSSCARFTNFIVMRNNPQGATSAQASPLAQFNIPQVASVAKDLTTTWGFARYYFKELPNCYTAEEAFLKVNVAHYQLHGAFKYTTFAQFKSNLFNTAA